MEVIIKNRSEKYEDLQFSLQNQLHKVINQIAVQTIYINYLDIRLFLANQSIYKETGFIFDTKPLPWIITDTFGYKVIYRSLERFQTYLLYISDGNFTIDKYVKEIEEISVYEDMSDVPSNSKFKF